GEKEEQDWERCDQAGKSDITHRVIVLLTEIHCRSPENNTDNGMTLGSFRWDHIMCKSGRANIVVYG
uniref:hypothetical protein n=1 Tax=Salmonella enterica TaxID=28901 RepID=UPI00398C70F7